MNKLLLIGCVVSAMAFAEEKTTAKTTEGMAQNQGMMTGWTPRKVTKEDKKGVEMALENLHKAWMSGDLNAAMSMMDFPVMMATDNKDGVVSTMMADSSTWQKLMEPNVKAMAENKEMAAQMAKMPKPKMDMFFLTDTMALVTSKGQMPMGKEKVEMRSAHFMVNKNGKWMVKGEMEGGWGDTMPVGMEMKGHEMKPAASTGATPPKG